MNSAARIELGKVAHLLSGGTPPKSDPAHWIGDVPWVSPKDMKRRFICDVPDHVSQEAARRYSTVAPENSILVVVRGMVLAKDFPVALIRKPMAINQDMKAIVAADEVDPTFLLFAILSEKRAIQKEIGSSAHGTRRLSSESLERLIIPMPPLPDQLSIATSLANIQAAIDVQISLVASLRDLKRETMATLFREGLRAEPVTQTEIGLLPKSWRLTSLLEAAFITEGQVDPRVEPFASMVHVGPDSVESGTGRLLNTRRAKELALISGKYQFSAGQIVYSKIRPYLRKVWAASFDGLCSADMYPLHVSNRFNADFLAAFLLADTFTAQVVALQDRTGIPKVNRQQLRLCWVPQPSEDEQRDIAEVSSILHSNYEHAVERLRLLYELFDVTLQELMSGCVDVKSRTEVRS